MSLSKHRFTVRPSQLNCSSVGKNAWPSRALRQLYTPPSPRHGTPTLLRQAAFNSPSVITNEVSGSFATALQGCLSNGGMYTWHPLLGGCAYRSCLAGALATAPNPLLGWYCK